SVAYFDWKDRALFVGRDGDVQRFAEILDDPETRVLVLHGESGVGKSPFLRAGVLPYLEEECFGYGLPREQRPGEPDEPGKQVLLVRATGGLAGALAQALRGYFGRFYWHRAPGGRLGFVDLPLLLTRALSLDRFPDAGVLRTLLVERPDVLGKILTAAGGQLPFAPLLIIDQCEEIYTLAQRQEKGAWKDRPEASPAGTVPAGLEAIRQAAVTSGRFKVILSVRTEYFGRLLDPLRQGRSDLGGVREYMLTDFDEVALAEALRRPTLDTFVPRTSDVPRAKYGFWYAEGMVEDIARSVVVYTRNRQDSVLPLAQVICKQLFDVVHTRGGGEVRPGDLERIGGVEGGMRQHVEGLVARLFGQPLPPVRNQERSDKNGAGAADYLRPFRGLA